MPRIKINDISLYYETQGDGEPVVFISGFSQDHSVWDSITDRLKTHHQVIVFDNRGSGQSDVPAGPYTIQQMAADLAGLCAELGLEKAHFVGNSMGGFIQQVLAVTYPELVSSLVISNSAMNADCVFHVYVAAQLELLKANAPLSALLQASSSWAFSHRFLSQPGMPAELIRLGLENPYPFTIAGYEGQYAALDRFNSTEWVHRIKAPVLVMGADQDLIFNEKSIKSLAEKIPGAEYFCFSECGHLPLLEYPDKFSALVKDFIADKN